MPVYSIPTAAILDVDRRLKTFLETDSVCHMTVILENRLLN